MSGAALGPAPSVRLARQCRATPGATAASAPLAPELPDSKGEAGLFSPEHTAQSRAPRNIYTHSLPETLPSTGRGLSRAPFPKSTGWRGLAWRKLPGLGGLSLPCVTCWGWCRLQEAPGDPRGWEVS